MKRPWLKFYPGDWRADPRLRMCSLAARGLWIDLISYMHEGEPYGHLTIGSMKVLLPDLQSLVGRPQREVENAFSELVARGVIAVTETGLFFSKRMVRDKVKEERDRENGKGGGNPAVIGWVNPQDNGGDKAQRLEASSPDSEKKKENSRTKGPTAYPDDFKIWWKSYPTTPIMAKKQAFVEWQRLSPEDRLAAFAALPGYKEFLRKNPTHAVVHGCRFLSQRRFDGFEDAAAERAPIVLGFHADEGSAELDAWDAYSRATKGKNCPRDRAGGWTVPSQWPPKIEAVA